MSGVRQVDPKLIAAASTMGVGRRALLVYRSTGSGKTNTAAGILAAFWKTEKKIILCTTVKNQAGNPPSEYAKLLLFFYPEMARSIFATLPPPPWWAVPTSIGSLERAFSSAHAISAWPI